jgi:hypothetical protein
MPDDNDITSSAIEELTAPSRNAGKTDTVGEDPIKALAPEVLINAESFAKTYKRLRSGPDKPDCCAQVEFVVLRVTRNPFAVVEVPAAPLVGINTGLPLLG